MNNAEAHRLVERFEEFLRDEGAEILDDLHYIGCRGKGSGLAEIVIEHQHEGSEYENSRNIDFTDLEVKTDD